MEVFGKNNSNTMKSVNDDVDYLAMKEIIKETTYLEILISQRDKIIDKLDQYPNSEFNELRKKELSPILKKIVEYKKNIRKNVRKISKEQYASLPFEVQEKVNLLDYETS